MNVKHSELVEISNNFLKENYDMELTVPIRYNARLKRAFGRFMYSKTKPIVTPKVIEMSTTFLQNHPKEHIIDVLLHELVHYALSQKGLPFTDGHPTFENELKKHGISSTHTYEYLGEMHKYVCDNCGHVYTRKRRLAKTASCGCSSYPNLNYEGVIKKTYEDLASVASETK
jgi:SprT-like protein